MNEHEEMKLKRLAEASISLNQQTTEMNTRFVEIEKKLCEMNLGVSGWASKLVGVREDSKQAYKFGFCRIGKERWKDSWKLVCRKVDKDDPNRPVTNYGLLEPITAMPRSIRLEASQLIGEVLDDMISRTNSFLGDVNSALDNLNSVETALDVDK